MFETTCEFYVRPVEELNGDKAELRQGHLYTDLLLLNGVLV